MCVSKNEAPQIFEYLIGASFIDLSSSQSLDTMDLLLGRIAEHIGPFPEHFLAACSRRDDYFDANGMCFARSVPFIHLINP